MQGQIRPNHPICGQGVMIHFVYTQIYFHKKHVLKEIVLERGVSADGLLCLKLTKLKVFFFCFCDCDSKISIRILRCVGEVVVKR